MNNSKIQKFSPSMIQLYIDCPLSFYYTYIAKIQIPHKQIHLLFGGAVHKAIEDGVYNTLDPYQSFTEEFDIKRLDKDEKKDHPEFSKLGYEMIKNYIVEHEKLNKLYNLEEGESELYIRRHIQNPLTGEQSSLPMTGRIDRLTNEGKIVEYKTSKSKWNPNDVNFKIQTLMYNLWYYAEYGELPNETVYIILLKKYKKNETDQTVQIISTHLKLVDLAAAFEEVKLIIHKINNNMFERPKGFHPKWCDCYKYEEILNIK